MNQDLKSLIREINELEYSCNAMLSREYEGLLNESITNSQIILLGHIHKQGRVLTGELSKIMNITPSAISQMLNKLEHKRFIKRSINLDNRREIFVELDVAGIEYMDMNEQIEQSIIDRFYSRLEKEELLSLKAIMMKFKQIIEAEQREK
ncbi:MarR family transcriptional regulator [Paenibacillus sp. HN-1]|uniref:MarR family winged helix-turn-helix transcriptional regulator n=1 Tax=Paenibacillus TaxID=44249 RepID=UPI001CA7F6CA|nr:MULTISPECIES: MarR family transcriptional regulator [Paenibacillus]MBY9077940.1 MarR family transcriptional regulator [Paenibacillus sp. CGMCC 1.18879]MBY9084642.1 MarR family transcriptional regulator [Paenibacillus sinensis]